MYQPYADERYYKEVYASNDIPADNISKALTGASRHVDVLTFNRICSKGINALTEYQQDVVRETVCELAEFEYENAELINSVLKSYSINGVSMEFGESWNITVQNGVAVKRDIYEKLCSTGLCCRSI